MKNKYFQNKPRIITILLMIVVSSLAIRALLKFQLFNTSLLYIGIPLLIAIVLIMVRDPSEEVSWKKHYQNRLIDAFIIMFGTSAVLFEGFVCVIMFIPIYLTVILIMFIIDWNRQRNKKQGSGTLTMHILPLFIFLSAFEGVSPQTSFDRNEQVSVSRVVEASRDEIKANLELPIALQKNRPWFLELFPMPVKVTAGSLNPGDIHKIDFEYYRWFFTNLHQGSMQLEITEVEDNRIKTTFLDDTSYIANYLRLKGTEIKLQQIDEQHTSVTLTIDFERKLDPYWYFSPVERFGMKKTAEFLLAEVIAREQF